MPTKALCVEVLCGRKKGTLSGYMLLPCNLAAWQVYVLYLHRCPLQNSLCTFLTKHGPNGVGNQSPALIFEDQRFHLFFVD